MHRTILVIKLAEESYAKESASQFDEAEQNANVTQCYPVTYPAPFNDIGCGYGVLSDYVKKLVDSIARQLDIEVDVCHQADLMLMIYSNSESELITFKARLAESLRPLKTWILNPDEVLNG